MLSQNHRRLCSVLLAITLLLASCSGADTEQAVQSDSTPSSQQATGNDSEPTELATEASTGDTKTSTDDTETSTGGSGVDSKLADNTKESPTAPKSTAGKTTPGSTASDEITVSTTTRPSSSRTKPRASTPSNKTGSTSPSGRPLYSPPSNPETKVGPSSPKPTTGTRPAKTSKPTTTTKPAITSKPTKPAITSKPTTTTKPAITSKPTTTTKPAVTSKPTTTSKPSAPSNGKTVWGYDQSSPSSSWKRPAIGSVYKDPAYNTPTRRMTSAEGTRFNRNTYSRRQAENANGSMFMTYHGDAAYHVYSVSDGSEISRTAIHPDGEPQWHPTKANIIRHVAGGNSYVGDLKLYETDVITNQTRPVADLTQRLKAAIPGAAYLIDRAEGSPSMDGNRYAWIVYNSSEKPVALASYDLSSDTVLGTTPLKTTEIDWVGMSPKGNYVVAGYLDGAAVYNANLSNRRELTEAVEHSDIALDKSGRETYVYIDFNSSSATDGWLTAVDMATLKRTKIFNIYDNANSSVHISGKGFDKPGWVVLSTYNCKVPGAWTCNKVMAVEIASQGRILNLAHTYNCGDQYWTETQAVVNRSFTRVYFNSDAGSCGMDAEVYRLDVPNFN